MSRGLGAAAATIAALRRLLRWCWTLMIIADVWPARHMKFPLFLRTKPFEVIVLP